MGYLHHFFDKPILHRDLKSLNLLMKYQITSEADQIITKITDFGLAREKGMKNEMMTQNAGTFHWMAPEVMDAKPYTHKADVFSYGIVLYEILSRTTPYLGMSATQIVAGVLSRRERPDLTKISDDCPIELRDLMIQCWDQDPDQRPDFRDIVQTLTEMQI